MKILSPEIAGKKCGESIKIIWRENMPGALEILARKALLKIFSGRHS